MRSTTITGYAQAIANAAADIGKKAATALTGGNWQGAEAYIDCGKMLAAVPPPAAAPERERTVAAKPVAAAPALGKRPRGRPSKAAKVALTAAKDQIAWLATNGPCTREAFIAGCNLTGPQFSTVTKSVNGGKILLENGLYRVPAAPQSVAA